MLYLRQLLILFVGLYTVRIVLAAIGVVDFGIYSAVAGIVGLGSFLSDSLAKATQRFFSHSLGTGDETRLKATFTVNLILYISVAAISLLMLQTIGLWFVEFQLSVPPGRADAVSKLFEFSTYTFVAGVLTTPFVAMMIAHEDMKIYAWISILDATLKLFVVFVLQSFGSDKLVLYGALLLAVGLVNLCIYFLVCFSRYNECQLGAWYWDRSLLHEVLGFTSWTIYGQVSTLARTHAITILLNQAFSPAVVAARSIAVQIANKVNIFSSSFNTGLYPPIIKAYTIGERKQMFSLVTGGSKITFYLLWIFALPMIVEMKTILAIWLTDVPNEAPFFAQLSLVETLIMSISMPLATAARAPGRMRGYELSLGSIQIGIFLVAWYLVNLGAPAYSVFIVAIAANLLMFGVRLFLVNGLVGLPMRLFWTHTVLPVINVIIVTYVPIYILSQILGSGFVSLLVVILMSFTFCIPVIYFLGLDQTWRIRARAYLLSRLK